MQKFPHLKIPKNIFGRARLFGGGSNKRSKENRNNRNAHSQSLTVNLVDNIEKWKSDLVKREEEELAFLDPVIQPIYLEFNPDVLSGELDFNLLDFGVEIISEEEGGFILCASLDNLSTLREKIEGFINKDRGSGKIADLWSIKHGDREEWKPQAILSETLFDIWQDIQDDAFFDLEVSIAFGFPTPKKPDQDKLHGLQSRNVKYQEALVERDELLMHRQDHFLDFIDTYGEVTSGLVDLEDSFGCEISINGKGLKDLVVNYPYVFDVRGRDSIVGEKANYEEFVNIDIELIEPDDDAVEIAIIDSGIMENHSLLNDSINHAKSKSYVFGDNSTNDLVPNGGHGTRVAGAVLYPKGISILTEDYKIPFKLRNLKVLDSNGLLQHQYAPELMETIIEDNNDCRVFNMSINSFRAFNGKHMSTWAATLDSLIFQKDVLFICSAGNIDRTVISDLLFVGETYPEYLDLKSNKIASPAQSSFSIVVGSINHEFYEDDDWISLGDLDQVSAFSRVGLGLWGHIKPDVVEYGGGQKVSKDGVFSISEKGLATELIRSNLGGGNAYDSDIVGTSFSAPKVSHIIGHLASLYSDEGINLWRALLIQGARLPGAYFRQPSLFALKMYGYGIPSLERVVNNTDHRITYYDTGFLNARQGKVYSLKIPENLRNPGEEYEILLEVTLAYTASTRRTRQQTKSYVGTWLDWSNSKVGESNEEFMNYSLKTIEGSATDYDKAQRERFDTLNWMIGARNTWGEIDEVSRNRSTIQKDYCIMNSYQLPSEMSFAIHAHKGWDKNEGKIPFAIVISYEILGQDIPIYNEIKIENELEVEV